MMTMMVTTRQTGHWTTSGTLLTLSEQTQCWTPWAHLTPGYQMSCTHQIISVSRLRFLLCDSPLDGRHYHDVTWTFEERLIDDL